MDVISILVTVALIGFITWALTYFIPMPEKFKTGIVVIAIVCVVLYLLSAFGLYHLPASTHPRR